MMYLIPSRPPPPFLLQAVMAGEGVDAADVMAAAVVGAAAAAVAGGRA